jgi:hypothetical protein
LTLLRPQNTAPAVTAVGMEWLFGLPYRAAKKRLLRQTAAAEKLQQISQDL